MKLKINFSILAFAFLILLFASCNKDEDLVTSDAKTGGLVVPTSGIPYKLGATPTVNVSVVIPQGPAISKVEVYNIYTGKVSGANKESNKVLMTTFDINGENASKDVTKTFTVKYADMIKGLTFNGAALPADEGQLPIGDFWTFSYTSILADGFKSVNNAKTKISVANQYAGFYQCTGVFTHPTAGPRPIDEEKFLTPVSAYSCNIPAGDLGASGYAVDITVDPATNEVSFSNGVPTAMFAQTGKKSYFEPSTGKFYLHYFYVGATGNRVIDEEYTPLK
ncbi:MAG: BT_3044 domain-containing protein [Deltaproteobacteria bacterium]